MAMYACKNIGCALNYCSLVKMGQPSDWEGSSDCMDEQKAFNKCMVDEQRRYNWMDKSIRPPMYEYVQNRIKERMEEDKFMGMIYVEEGQSRELKDAINEEVFEKQAERQTLNQ